MDTFKAVRILSKFSDSEWKKFKRYIEDCGSPKVREIVKTLYTMRRKDPPSKLLISQKRPDLQEYIDDLMYRLLCHIVDFICTNYPPLYTEVREAERLLAFLSERNLPEDYAAHYRKVKENIDKNPPASALDHLALYEFYKTVAIHEKILKGRKLSVSINLYELQLDSYYWIEKLKLVCERVGRGKIITNDDAAIPQSMSHVLDFSLEFERENALIFIYRRLLVLLSQTRPIEMSILIELFEKFRVLRFSDSTLADTLTISHYLINLILRGTRAGILAYCHRFIELIDFMEEKKILLERGVISAPIFKACISVGMQAGKDDWTRSFFEKYKSLLPVYQKDEIAQYCKALMLYREGAYQKASAILWDIADTTELDLFFKINIRILEILIYVESSLKNKDITISVLDSMLSGLTKSIKTQKEKDLSEYKKEGIANFAKYIRRLIIVWDDEPQLQLFKAELEEGTNTNEKHWLLAIARSRTK